LTALEAASSINYSIGAEKAPLVSDMPKSSNEVLDVKGHLNDWITLIMGVSCYLQIADFSGQRYVAI